MRSKMTVGSAFETIAKEVKDSKFKKEKWMPSLRK